MLQKNEEFKTQRLVGNHHFFITHDKPRLIIQKLVSWCLTIDQCDLDFDPLGNFDFICTIRRLNEAIYECVYTIIETARHNYLLRKN